MTIERKFHIKARKGIEQEPLERITAKVKSIPGVDSCSSSIIYTPVSFPRLFTEVILRLFTGISILEPMGADLTVSSDTNFDYLAVGNILCDGGYAIQIK